MKKLEVLKPNGERQLYIMPDKFYLESGDGFTRFTKRDKTIILHLPNSYAWCVLDFLESSPY